MSHRPTLPGTASRARLSCSTARAEALFASDLPGGSWPDRELVDAAVRAALRRLGGVRGCVAELAAAYGERPETTAARMRWAVGVVARTHPGGR